MNRYLQPSLIIDSHNHLVMNQARYLRGHNLSELTVVRRCFNYVRDQVEHTGDVGQGPLTLTASQVLIKKTGFCFAKSHLFAALLRAIGIPTALCYQRLRLADNQFCLHGLNAVYLRAYGWVRIDPRGKEIELSGDFRKRVKSHVSRRFQPPRESLVYCAVEKGEQDGMTLYAEPLDVVIEAYHAAACLVDFELGLPDSEL